MLSPSAFSWAFPFHLFQQIECFYCFNIWFMSDALKVNFILYFMLFLLIWFNCWTYLHFQKICQKFKRREPMVNQHFKTFVCFSLFISDQDIKELSFQQTQSKRRLSITHCLDDHFQWAGQIEPSNQLVLI